MNTPKDLALVLRRLRLHHQLPAKDIAQALGKSSAQYSKIEAGDTRLSFYDFLQVLQFLKTPATVVHNFLEEAGITSLSIGQDVALNWLLRYPEKSMLRADVLALAVLLAKHCREHHLALSISADGQVHFQS